MYLYSVSKFLIRIESQIKFFILKYLRLKTANLTHYHYYLITNEVHASINPVWWLMNIDPSILCDWLEFWALSSGARKNVKPFFIYKNLEYSFKRGLHKIRWCNQFGFNYNRKGPDKEDCSDVFWTCLCVFIDEKHSQALRSDTHWVCSMRFFFRLVCQSAIGWCVSGLYAACYV